MNLTEVKNIRQEKTVKEKDFIIPRYTQTNEQVSLMFVMNIKKNVVAKMNDGRFVQKNYLREYEGNFCRTYSFIDLLNLVYIKHNLKKGEEFYIND